MNKFLVSMVASACLVGACSAAVAGNTGMYVLGGFGTSANNHGWGDDIGSQFAIGKRTDSYDFKVAGTYSHSSMEGYEGVHEDYINGTSNIYGVAMAVAKIHPVNDKWSFRYGLAAEYHHLTDTNDENNEGHGYGVGLFVGPSVAVAENASIDVDLHVLTYDRDSFTDVGGHLTDIQLFNGVSVGFLYFF